MLLGRELLNHLTYRVFAPGALSRARYEAFCDLLTLSDQCQERIALLEAVHHGQSVVDWSRVVFLVQELDDLGDKIVAALTSFSPSKGVLLLEYFRKIAFYLKLATDIPPPDASPPFVLPLARGDADAARLGNKAATLAWAMNLPELPVPQGFVVTSSAFHYFLEAGNLRGPLDEQLRKLSLDDPAGVREGSAVMRALLSEARIPSIILAEMEEARARLSAQNVRLAVRSSAAEEGASDIFAFPGRYDSFLNILPDDLAKAWRRVVMGKYSPGALTWRIRTGLSDMEMPMAVLVMPMVDAAYAGVCHTRDPGRPAGSRGATSLYAVPGPGENLAGGRTSPGVFCIDAGTSLERSPEVLQRPAGFTGLSDATVTRLARLALQLEKLFKAPQAVEWAVDKSGRPWILQSRSIGRDQAPASALSPRRLPETLIEDAARVAPVGLALARQEKLLPHVALLNLVDPDSPGFRPEGCRSMHDVARYAEETAVREMFALAGATGGLARVKELKSRLPLALRVLDLGRGLFLAARGRTEIVPDDITSTPMWALWLGLSSVPESLSSPLDRHGEDASPLDGFAVIDEFYTHLMLRLGRHFCTVDALCEQEGEQNRVVMGVGGRGRYEERLPQLDFLSLVLAGQGFETTRTGGLLTARLAGAGCTVLRQRLVVIGRLIMATRLLDLPLTTENQVREEAERFSHALARESTA